MEESEALVRTAETSARYTIEQVLYETGFSRRAISYYITQGLIPKAFGRGPTAYYTEADHLRVLRLIRRAQDERRTLADIKDAVLIARAARRPPC